MAEFTLPKNSKITSKGRTYKAEEGKRLASFLAADAPRRRVRIAATR